MNKDTYLKKIVEEFCSWYDNDIHSKNKDSYQKFINRQYLASLKKDSFIDFFYEFVSVGGKVQSGGDRTKNKFLTTISNQFEGFKAFVLLPFDKEFDLKNWFEEVEKFKGFGIGIATIYLNKINRNNYPIMNNKTINALRKIGYNLAVTKSYKTYLNVKRIQDELILMYPELENYYKADAFNHFLIAVYQGKHMASGLQKINDIEDTTEQIIIEEYENNNKKPDDKTNILAIIKENETNKTETITIKGKTYKRHNYLMVKIKEYRNFQCQFCSTKIKKANGGFYIEACHINPKANRGADRLDNILVLCPNCHKLFDYGKRTKEKKENGNYSVVINGKKYTASLI
jgi:5-methylcytosine-specific restriction endonuclease McrA